MKKITLIFAVLLLISTAIYSQTIITIGNSGDDYTTIEAAYNDIPNLENPITGSYILEVQSDYDPNSESLPITLGLINGAGASNTITIRPAADVVSVTILNTATLSVFRFSGANYVIIDGRPDGVGSSGVFNFASNLAVNVNTISFISNADNNTFKYCNISGANNQGAQGVISFATGCDNNTIDYCNFGKTDGYPSQMIYLYGDNQTISNCNIQDFGSYAIFGAGYNWNITGNSFYQSANQTTTVSIIAMNILSGGGHNISGNYFGGQAPMCGGLPFTVSFTNRSLKFLNFGNSVNGANTTIEFNTFKNIVVNNDITLAAMNGINCITIGACTSSFIINDNVFGGTSGTDDIVINSTGTGSGSLFYGVWALNTGIENEIFNNTFGSLTISSTATASSSLYNRFIYLQNAGDFNIHDNTFGNSTANNIYFTNTRQTFELLSISASGNVTIFNNLFQNIYHAGNTTTSGLSYFIYANAGQSVNVTGNTLGNNNNDNIVYDEGTKLYGIYSSVNNAIIENNTIQNFKLTNAGNNALFQAIYQTGGVMTCSNNDIKNITTSSIATTASVTGIYSGNGNTVVSNNNISDITTNLFTGIQIASGGDVSVKANIIGGATPGNISCSGSNDNYGIYFSSTGAYYCNDNVVQQFNTTNSNNVKAIAFANGNLASCNNNTIRDITVTSGTFYGITAGTGGSGSQSITNNNIYNLNCTAPTYCIDINTTGNVVCDKNMVGSSTTNNITLDGSASEYYAGIKIQRSTNALISNNTIQEFHNLNTSTGNRTIGIYVTMNAIVDLYNNVIQNFDIAGAGEGMPYVVGIYMSTTTTGQMVRNCRIYNLESLNNGSGQYSSNGIYIGNGAGTVMNCDISNLSVNSTSNLANAHGITVTAGSWNLYNNVIINNNNGLNTPTELRGISVTAIGTCNVYHNTVKLYGTSSGGLTECIYQGNASGTVNIKNNIFQNLMTGSGTYYSVRCVNAGGTTVYNSNYLETAATPLAWYVGSNINDIATWNTQASVGDDINGTITVSDINGYSSDAIIQDAGEDLTSIVVDDKGGEPRTSLPWIGAFEGPNYMITSTNVTDLICESDNTGAIDLTVINGFPPYTYLWDSGQTTEDISGLAAGTYTVTIKDADLVEEVVVVNVNFLSSTMTLTPSSTNLLCNGDSDGSASIAVAGGTSPYTYLWSTTETTSAISGLTANIYTVTVTDNYGCGVQESITITEPAALSLTAASQTNVACNGGSNGAASVNAATGGAGGYTYNWTPGTPVGDGTTSVTGLAAGTLTCEVTDVNSCVASYSFTITEPTALSLTSASQTNVSCNGGLNGAATVNSATGGAGSYTYNWTPGNPTGNGTTTVTGLSANTWTCEVTDANACVASYSFTITEPAILSLTQASHTNVSCNGGSDGIAVVNAATGGAGGYTYDWTPGTPTGDGTTSITGLTAGTWTCDVTDANGCVTSQVFILTEPTLITGTENVTACDSYIWSANTTTYTASGTYMATLTSVSGCDSVVTLNLTINLSNTGDTTAVACDSFDWYGTTYTVSGTPTHTFTNVDGCDSVVTLTLTINPVYATTDVATICEGDSFIFGTQTLTVAGDYTETFASVLGCDSIVTLTLTVNPVYATTDAATICEGDSFIFGTQTLTMAGDYTETFASVLGCDSVVTLTLTVNPVYATTDAATICEGDSYIFGTQTLTMAGDFTETFASVLGCDSVVTLTVTVNPVYATTDAATICEGDSYIFGTQTLTTAGDFTETFASVLGCDSVVTLTLIVNPVYATTDAATICEGDSYIFGTQTLTTAGDFTETFASVLGCDSVVTLTLTVNPVYATTDAATICEGDSFIFGTQTLTIAGNYSETFASVFGCDSVVTLSLTVNPEYFSVDTVDLCWGDSLFFAGRWISRLGMHYDSLITVNGCDSVISIYINKLQSFIEHNDLFFSEYIEGSSNNKAIEIFNPKNEEVNLSHYTVSRFNNGSAFPSFVETLSGILASGDVYVIANASADSVILSRADITNALTFYNGDDALLLINNVTGDTLDIFGRIGEDPGTNWNSGSFATSEQTLIRRRPIVKGIQNNPSSGFPTLEEEWISRPTNYFDDLGTHNGLLRAIVAVDEAICQGDSIFIGGSWQSISGIYIDSLLTIEGCDSIVETTLTVNPVYATTDAATICEGDSYIFGTQTLTMAGDYTETFASVLGCDSVVTLTLTVNPVYATTDAATICEGDSYIFGTQTLTMAGDFTEIFASVLGCDSVVTLTLTVNPVFATTDAAIICEGDSYIFGTQTLTTSGDFTETFASELGCDSVVTLTLTVNPVYVINESAEICEGGTYTLPNGTDVTVAGTYNSVFTSALGCDSTVVTELIVHPVYNITETVQICSGSDYMLPDGTIVNTDGTYTSNLTTLSGCDSTIVTNLVTTAQIVNNIALTICEGDSIFAEGSWQYSTGIFHDTTTAAFGCDSIIVTDLTVNPVYSTTDVATICDGDNYIFGTQTLTVAGDYTETFASELGCDSVVTLTLTVNPVYSTTDAATICEGDSYIFGTQTLTVAGDYTETFASELGCDSVVTLTLTVNPVYVINESAEICEGGTYTLPNGTDVTVAGTYNSVFTSALGCDSTIVTDLIVNPVYNITETVQICSGSDYMLPDGTIVNTDGTYTSNLTTLSGCDSTIVTNLVTTAQIVNNVALTICEGDSIFAEGSWQYSTGIFHDTTTAAFGCDSIIVTDLTVNPVYSTTDAATICDGDSYIFGTQTLTVAGDYTETFASVLGCDSLVTLTLTVNPLIMVDLGADDTLCFENAETLTLDAGNAGMSYLWSDDSTAQTFVADAIALGMGTHTIGVTVTDGVCTSTDEIVLMVDICSGIASVNEHLNVSMYPNPTKGKLNIAIEGLNSEATLSIMDVSGRTVINETLSLETTMKQVDFSNLPKGIYAVKVTSVDVVKVNRIVLQ